MSPRTKQTLLLGGSVVIAAIIILFAETATNQRVGADGANNSGTPVAAADSKQTQSNNLSASNSERQVPGREPTHAARDSVSVTKPSPPTPPTPVAERVQHQQVQPPAGMPAPSPLVAPAVKTVPQNPAPPQPDALTPSKTNVSPRGVLGALQRDPPNRMGGDGARRPMRPLRQRLQPNAAGGKRLSPKDELKLLEKARTSMRHLHGLRLRTDVPRAQSEQERESLRKVLQQLPPRIQRRLRRQVRQGFDRRARRANRGDGMARRRARAVDVGSAGVGNVDDYPPDIDALERRIRMLRKRLGQPSLTRERRLPVLGRRRKIQRNRPLNRRPNTVQPSRMRSVEPRNP